MGRLITPQDYIYKTAPFQHQEEVFMLSRHEDIFALLMDRGTGKSKVIIDNAAYLYSIGAIQALLVIAPNGVHRNWIDNEVPEHLPDHIDRIPCYWSSNMRKKEREQFDALYSNRKGLRIFTVNVEALSSAKGVKEVQKFLSTFKCFWAIDESTRIKGHKAERTKNILKMRKLAPYRRILTGLITPQSPLDLYTQYYFLDPEVLGFSSFYGFRSRYAVIEEEYDRKRKATYTVVTGYIRLDELQDKINKCSYRKRKEECLDLPDKVYQKHYVTLSKEQLEYYNQMKNKLIVEIEGNMITAPMAMTLLGKLQQIIGGHIIDSENNSYYTIPGGNARLDALHEIIDDLPEETKLIVWARYKPELRTIAASLREKYGDETVVEYHGDIKSGDVRAENVNAFQGKDSPVRFFVGNAQSGGIGLTLTAATYVIYYSNDFSLENRLQSEDRAHRIGQEKKVTYIDLMVPGTIDEKIVEALREKKNIADIIIGDRSLSTWI